MDKSKRMKLTPDQREELKFDLRMGMGTMDAARKFGITPSTVSGYRARLEKKDELLAESPPLTPDGDLDVPPGLDPKVWLEKVRDNPKAPWDARKAAGLALYKSAERVEETDWQPSTDPDAWAHDLSLLILAQPAAVAKAVTFKLVEALDLGQLALEPSSSSLELTSDQAETSSEQ